MLLHVTYKKRDEAKDLGNERRGEFLFNAKNIVYIPAEGLDIASQIGSATLKRQCFMEVRGYFIGIKAK